MTREDVRAIERLKYRYCYAIDGGDYETWADLFTPDGRFVRGNGDAYEGRDAVYRFAAEEFDAAFEGTAHVVVNPVIEVDGDEATGKWYLFLLTESPGGDTGWIQATYDDRYRKVEGSWRVEETVVTYGVTP